MARFGKTSRGRARAARRRGYARRRPARGRSQLRQAYAELSRAAGVAVPFARPGPAPSQIAHRKLRYVDYMNAAATTVGMGYTQDWVLNSVYDPYAGAGGHQPLGYDQMAAFYNRYRVVGATITAEWEQGGSAGIRRPMVGISITPTSNFPANTDSANQCAEQPYTVYKILADSASANGKAVITRKLKTFKPFFGDAYLTDDSYAALIGANPTNLIHAQVWARPQQGSESIDAHKLCVTITYDVIFYDPKSDYPQS